VGLGLDLNTTNFHLRWAAKAQASGTIPADLGHPRAHDWLPLFLDSISPPLTADRTMGALGSIAASRIARAFQCAGPSFAVCSEESSAGRAIELAVRALRAGELDRAVVGGVDLAGDPRVVLPASGVGAIPGEGAAAVV